MNPDIVAIDECHIDLIYGFAVALKPNNILELGYGSGRTTNALIRACDKNNLGKITLVDSWYDWHGSKPDLNGIENNSRIELIVSTEENFVRNCNNKFDLIVSDADHTSSHQWWQQTIDLLNEGGIALFHDVTNNDFPNLKNIILQSEVKYKTKVFNKSSSSHERCERGLLVLFK